MLDLTFPLTIHHANRCLRAALIALLCACAFSVAIAAPPVQLSGAMVSGGDVGLIAINSTSTRVVFIADRETDATNELYSARVVFRAGKDINDVLELYSAPIAAANATTKLSGTLLPGGVVLDGFLISPDSARVVFRADKDNDEVFELYSAPIATANATTKLSGTLVPSGDVFNDFQISPDSTRVVFRADKDTDGVLELYSVAIGGGGAMLDIDGDGVVLPTTDLLMMMRWQLGIRGAALFGGITFSGTATRTSVAVIEDHLRRLAEAGLAC